MFSLPGKKPSPAIIALVAAIVIVVGFAGAGLAVAIVGVAVLLMAAVQFLLEWR
jgi:hypothetical protein